MNKPSARLTAIVGTTMALVIAGSTAVAAAGPRHDDRAFGRDRDQHGMGMQRGQMGPGARLRGLRGIDADFERREVTLQTADGTTSTRVEQGVVAQMDDTSLSFSLGSGETVTVLIDEDTRVVAVEEQDVVVRGWSRTRMVPTEIELADIAAGAGILVWSDAEDGADFVASRILVQPDEAAEDTDADAADVDAADEATVAEEVEASATLTDA